MKAIRRTVALGAAALGAMLAAAFAANAQPATTVPGIDLDHYNIDVRVDPLTQYLNARAEVHFTTMENTGAVVFELNNALTVSRVTDGAGQQLESARNPGDNTILVTYPGTLAKGTPSTLIFNYDGRLTGDEDSPVYGIKFAAIQNDYAFLLYPARWFPVYGYTASRFTSTVNLTVPSDYTGVGSGPMTSKPGAAGQTVYTFDFTHPSFPGDIAVVKGQPVKVSSGGATTTLWFRGAEAAQANAAGELAGNMMDYFRTVYGLPPSANLTIVETADGAPNGYAAPGLVFLAPHSIGKEINVNVLANQLGRQWCEVLVSPANRNHLWLENGMALYSEAIWTEHDKGAAAFDQRMKDMAITALTVDDVPAIQTARLDDYSPEYWALSGDRGAVVARMLRSVVGDDKFNAALKDFYSKNAWKAVLTSDFRAAFEAQTGSDLQYFFREWIETNSAPEFKLDWTEFRTDKGFRIQGKITSDLDTFRMPIMVHVETEGNPVDQVVEVEGASSDFSVETFGKPKDVKIDTNSILLLMNPDMRVAVAVRRGEEYAQIGEYADALKEYQKALTTRKNSSIAHYRVGEAFFVQQNYQAASNEFREALNGDLDPKWLEVWSDIYLGKIYDVVGERDRAVNEYNQAQRTRDNTQGAQDQVAMYLKTPYQRTSTNGI